MSEIGNQLQWHKSCAKPWIGSSDRMAFCSESFRTEPTDNFGEITMKHFF